MHAGLRTMLLSGGRQERATGKPPARLHPCHVRRRQQRVATVTAIPELASVHHIAGCAGVDARRQASMLDNLAVALSTTTTCRALAAARRSPRAAGWASPRTGPRGGDAHGLPAGVGSPGPSATPATPPIPPVQKRSSAHCRRAPSPAAPPTAAAGAAAAVPLPGAASAVTRVPPRAGRGGARTPPPPRAPARRHARPLAWHSGRQPRSPTRTCRAHAHVSCTQAEPTPSHTPAGGFAAHPPSPAAREPRQTARTHPDAGDAYTARPHG